MASVIQSLIVAALQGVGSVLPISGDGHAILIPAVAQWHIDPQSTAFLSIMSLSQLGASLGLFIAFHEEWFAILHALWMPFAQQRLMHTQSEHMGLLILTAFLPTLLFGVLFQLLASTLVLYPLVVATLIAVNGFSLLFVRERGKGKKGSVRHFSKKQSLGIGMLELSAFLPGISRIGVAFLGARLHGLSAKDGFTYAALLSAPVLFLASLFSFVSIGTLTDPLLGIFCLLLSTIIAALLARILKQKGIQGKLLDALIIYSWALSTLSVVLVKFLY